MTARIYGKWGGCPQGVREDPRRCIVSVSTGWLYAQCSRQRGWSPTDDDATLYSGAGLYCRQHAVMLAKGKHLSIPEPEEC
jgi:hypothetical protein